MKEKKPTTKIVLLDEARFSRAMLILEALQGKPDTYEMILKPHKVDRSASQNAIYQIWMRTMGAELGYTSEEMKFEMKRMFLLPIYKADPDEKHNRMREALDQLNFFKSEGYGDRATVVYRNLIADLSTTKASLDQFREYLDLIDRHAASLSIILPRKSAEYYEAMGIKEA